MDYQQLAKLIDEAATLDVGIKMLMAKNQPIPPEWASRAHELTTIANSLPPEIASQAEIAFNQRVAQVHDHTIAEQQKAEDQRYTKNVTNTLRTVTRDIGATTGGNGGLDSLDQYQQALNTGKVTLKNKAKVAINRQQLDKITQDAFGVDSKTHAKRLDAIWEAGVDSEKGERLMKKYGITRDLAKEWVQGGAGIEYGLLERAEKRSKDEPDEVELELSDEQQRRLNVVASLAEYDQDPSENREEFIERNRPVLEEDSRSGDIARAIVDVSDRSDDWEVA